MNIVNSLRWLGVKSHKVINACSGWAVRLAPSGPVDVARAERSQVWLAVGGLAFLLLGCAIVNA